MSIKARNAHFTNWAKVVAALADKGVTDESTARAFLANSENNPFYYMVCFIKDSKELYTHGQFYNCSEYDDTELRDLISALTQEVADNEFVTATTLTILENNKADKAEFETLKKEVEENEFVTAEALTSLENNKAEKSDIPDVSKFVNVVDLHKIATSGSYNDLKDKPETVSPDDIANFGFIKGVSIDGSSTSVSEGIADIPIADADNYGVVKTKSTIDYNDTESVPTMEAMREAVRYIYCNGSSYYPSQNNGCLTLPVAGSSYGMTRLSSSVSSTSTTYAATSSAVKQAYDLANSYKGTVTGVKLNGTTKSPSSGTVDLGNIPTSIKLNGTTKTPSNGVVDLGNVATTEYADTNFVKKLGQDEEITINNSCNNGDCTTNLSLKCVSDDSKFKLESWHLGDFSKISGDCRGNLDFTAATHVEDYDLVTSTLSLRHDSLKWNDKQLATEEYVDSKLDSVETLVLITHSELKTLRDNSQLIPGTFYRITDYETKLSDVSENVGSGGRISTHVLWGEEFTPQVSMDFALKNYYFDIVVVALSPNEISEQAYAVHSSRDVEGHFTNRNLSAWKVYYRLENKHDFWYIPKTAKGVIYKLINEYGNEAPYDFENVYYDGLPVFGSECTNNILEGYYITLGSNCHFNHIGKNSVRIKIGDNSSGNTFGVACRGIVLGSYCDYNTFGNNCKYLYDNIYGTFGGGFWINESTPRNYCSHNTFANGCAPHLECSASANASSNLQHLCILTNSYGYLDESGSALESELKYSAIISLPIDIINSSGEIRVGINSNGEIRIYRLEDLIN